MIGPPLFSAAADYEGAEIKDRFGRALERRLGVEIFRTCLY